MARRTLAATDGDAAAHSWFLYSLHFPHAHAAISDCSLAAEGHRPHVNAARAEISGLRAVSFECQQGDIADVLRPRFERVSAIFHERRDTWAAIAI
jgi:hypothetical protein